MPPVPDDRPPIPRPAAAAAVRRTLLVTVVLTAVLAVVIVGRLITAPAADTSPRAVPGLAWPTAGLSSPTTPAGDHPWAGTLLPPTTPASTATGSGTDTVAAAAARDPSGVTADAAFCRTARAGLRSLGSTGLSTLKAMATTTGDVAPQVRSFVSSAAAEADRLHRAAPPALTEALGRLAAAWSGLEAALERAGYDRATVLGLAIKYLTGPAVSLSWDVLTRWSHRTCGTDLLGGTTGA